MENRQKRLFDVFQYLRGKGKVHTQKDFADVLKIQRSNLSAAMNGNNAYLTDNLFAKICAYFPEISLQWLLKGEGKMIIANNTFLIDESANDDVVQEAETTRKLIESLENLVKAQQVHIAYLDKEIANKNEEIKALKSSKKDGRDWGGFGVSTADERAKK